jgi:hypothetical protein
MFRGCCPPRRIREYEFAWLQCEVSTQVGAIGPLLDPLQDSRFAFVCGSRLRRIRFGCYGCFSESNTIVPGWLLFLVQALGPLLPLRSSVFLFGYLQAVSL